MIEIKITIHDSEDVGDVLDMIELLSIYMGER